MTDEELIKRARALLMTIGQKRLGVDIERPEDWMAIDVVEDALPALFRAVDERDALAHDIARHVQIASDQATEIAALRKRVAGLEDRIGILHEHMAADGGQPGADAATRKDQE